MPDFFKTPSWINRLRQSFVNDADYRKLNERLKQVTTEKPVVSVVIPAYNEEKTIFRTINSIAWNETSIPFEILIVNNNSTDNTAKILERLHVKKIFQETPGCGIAREKGQQEATGKYILTADADCFYPPKWIQTMYEHISRPGVSACFSKHSFFSDDIPRWKFALYEIPGKIIAEIRNFKRPYLNCHTMSMIYPRELGVQIGFNTRQMRGSDGRLCFDLMKHGKVKYIRTQKAKVWTLPRTVLQDGNLLVSFLKRALKELIKLPQYLFPRAPHDTKTSKN